MKFIKIISEVAKYLPFVGLISLQILSICTAAANLSDEMERAVRIWQATLLIAVTVGMIVNLFAMDQLSKLTTGKRQSIFTDLMENSSGEISVLYNGYIVYSLFVIVIVISEYFYIRTNMLLFSICSHVLAIVLSLSVFVRMLALYIKNNQEREKTFLSKLLNPMVLPSIICFFLLLATNNKMVGFVYRNLQMPTNTAFLILALIIVLCYVLAVVFCHYSNLYYITAFAFVTKDPGKIQANLDAVEKKDAEREASLRQLSKYVDETALKVCFFKKIRLAIHFFHTHMKAYWKGNVYAVSYLLSYVKLRITQRLGGLLEEDRIRTHMIRFCEITVVLELLTLNMLLFIYLGSDNPCSRFFELLSTVIIIPILLSSLSNLKMKKVESE